MDFELLETISYVSVISGFVCTIIILIDILNGHRQKMKVMNIVWPITGIYFGPVGLWAYLKMGRTDNEKPFWQKVFVSTSHCGAGCTFGDLIGEWGIFLIGFTLFASELLTVYIVDFSVAYITGIIFQYAAIAQMNKMKPLQIVKAAVKADTFSLVAFEIGMFGWMAITHLVLFTSPLKPDNITYWFMMQIAMVIGFLTSYPANWLLVKKGIKEGM